MRGDKWKRTKLSVADVIKIRVLLKERTQESIAREFGVSNGAIRAIIEGRTWKYVADPTIKMADGLLSYLMFG
jgi:hypothetical protein